MKSKIALMWAGLLCATSADALTFVDFLLPMGGSARITVYFKPNAPINFSYGHSFEFDRSAYANGEFWYRNNYADGSSISVDDGVVRCDYCYGGPALFFDFPSIKDNVLRITVRNPTNEYLLEGTKPWMQFYYADVYRYEEKAGFIYDPDVSYYRITPVPEPLTWGLMIAGFGLVGWQLRARATRSNWFGLARGGF